MYITLDRVLDVEDTPGCTTRASHTPRHANQRRACFIKLVEEKKRHKKEKKAPLSASRQNVKSDVDAEPYARIRGGEKQISSPISSHFSLESKELHSRVYKLVRS